MRVKNWTYLSKSRFLRIGTEGPHGMRGSFGIDGDGNRGGGND